MVALLHAAIEQKLQSNGAFVFGSYDKYQYDYFLNRGAYTFIKRFGRKKPFWNEVLEESPIRHEAINSLVERTTINLSEHYTNVYVGQLPPDYLMLLDDNLNFFHNCKAPVITTTTTETVEYICVFDLPDDSRVDRNHNYFQDFRITLFNNDLTTSTIYDTADYAVLNEGILNNEEKYIILQHILNTFSNKDGNFYYEFYRGKFYPGKLIYVLKDPVKEPLAIVNYFGVSAEEYIYFEDAATYETVATSENGTAGTATTRLVRHYQTNDLLRHPFGKTTKDSPILNIDRRQIYYYVNENFVPTTTELVYIKRPLFTSHILEQYAELYDEYRDELVAIVVGEMLASNGAANYQLHKSEYIFND